MQCPGNWSGSGSATVFSCSDINSTTVTFKLVYVDNLPLIEGEWTKSLFVCEIAAAETGSSTSLAC
jgi:hypothetical protein